MLAIGGSVTISVIFSYVLALFGAKGFSIQEK